MSAVPARLSIVTLGVEELARSIAFYEALGWERRASSVPDVIAWFSLGSCYLGVFPRDELAADAAIADPGPPPRFGGITLGTVLKPAETAIFGGLSGYFADPDGHPWEVAWNPGLNLGEDGSVTFGGGMGDE